MYKTVKIGPTCYTFKQRKGMDSAKTLDSKTPL